MPQRAGEDHQQLLLTRAGVPGGGQFTGHLSRQGLGDPPHPRIVRGPRRSREPEPRPGVKDEAFRFGPGTQTGPYPGLPPHQNRLLDRLDLRRSRRAPCPGLLRHPPLHGALRHPQHGGHPPGGTPVRREQEAQAGLGARGNGPGPQALQPLRDSPTSIPLIGLQGCSRRPVPGLPHPVAPPAGFGVFGTAPAIVGYGTRAHTGEGACRSTSAGNAFPPRAWRGVSVRGRLRDRPNLLTRSLGCWAVRDGLCRC